MREFEADPSHPRYHSLWLRHKLELAQHAGMLANSAMIAHGRGEAFDYLLGEKTTDSARHATKIAAAKLQDATKPIICLNGNTTALAADTMLQIAEHLQCPIEINIFYRTNERMKALINYLSERKEEDKQCLNRGIMKHIKKNFEYPKIAKEMGIQEKIYVKFVIDKTGAVTDVKVLRGEDRYLKEEAMRLVKSIPKMTPANQRGKPVGVNYTIPINFMLN